MRRPLARVVSGLLTKKTSPRVKSVTSSVPLSFVLISQNIYPDPARVIAEAGRLGLGLAHEMGEPNVLNFRIEGGGDLIVMPVDTPHPDAATMPVGPASPEPSIIADHVGHIVATALNLPEEPMSHDVVMGIVTTALIHSSPAIAAMLGHGAIFHRSDMFAAFVEAAGTDIATEITVDITAARESEDRMSFLTHGLGRYGREEFYVTSLVNSNGALDYVMALAKLMITDQNKVLLTGDIVGRTPEEHILVQRVPSPIEGKPPVIRLDMDDSAAFAPKKTSWFRSNVGLLRKRR
jgi:hypothetical protein